MSEAIVYINPIINSSQLLLKERRIRKDQYDRETIAKNLLDDFVSKGWIFDRELKTKIKIKKPIPISKELKNKLWLLMESLGFPELNQGKDFSIALTKSNKVIGTQKIDLFAKDDETVVVAICKTSEHLKKNSMQSEISEFAKVKGQIALSIKKHYGADFKPKLIWMIATSNIIWSEKDKNRALDEKLNIVTEKELRYFLELAKHLGQAGKYQFLAHFLEGQKIPSLKGSKVPAIRGKLGGHTFFAFVTTPNKLLKISFINHRTLNDPQSAPSYQRLIDKKRIKEIETFINRGGYFPTNIIINFISNRRFDIRESDKDSNIHFGTLYLPEKFKSAWVIDGQHRLYGFSGLEKAKKNENIFVLAFQKMRREDEANLFVTINHEQKTVPKSLLQDLQGELHWGSEDTRQRLLAMCSRLVNILNDEFGESFYRRVVQTGLRGNREVCLTLPQLVEGLRKSSLLGSYHSRLKIHQVGPFTGIDDYETLDRARHSLNNIFNNIRQSAPKEWSLGADTGICTNTGIAAFFLIISESFTHYERVSKNVCNEHTPEELAVIALGYLEPLLKIISINKIAENTTLFKEGVPYGSRGPKELFLKLTSIIREKTPDFGPDDFVEWKNAQEKERVRLAAEKIQELNSMICETLFDLLINHYGEKYYWDKSVSDKTMKSNAYTRSLDEDVSVRGKLEEYLMLIEYKKIAEKKEHWPFTKKVFNIPLQGEKGVAKNLKWLDELNNIRKKTSHSTKGRMLSLQDIEFVEWLYDEFFSRVEKYNNQQETT